MSTDESLQFTVQQALRWEPQMHDAQLGVTAHKGIITLMGILPNYFLKVEAERIVKNIDGVRAIVEKIAVVFPQEQTLSDEKLAESILRLYQSSFTIPDERIRFKVENGWVTLEGTLHWNYQKKAAEAALSSIKGIRGISNLLHTQSDYENELLQESIVKALHHSAVLSDAVIAVTLDHRKVTLTGSVNNLYEKDEAERLAWNAPGIASVSNKLEIRPFVKVFSDERE
jgi:osmotically-inducible protein OsmY